MAEQVKVILEFKDKGAIALDYGNNIRAMAKETAWCSAIGLPN